jgi:hypothetical protein
VKSVVDRTEVPSMDADTLLWCPTVGVVYWVRTIVSVGEFWLLQLRLTVR